jgi:two-component system chemotaxis sensor kinase CheA
MARDPLKYFRIEARELVEQLGSGVLALEREPGSSEILGALLRHAHTLKGAARVVKQTEIGELAHRLEDVLGPYRGGGELTRADVNLSLGLVDRIGAELARLAPAEPAPAPEAARTLEREPVATPRADSSELDSLIEGVTEAHVQLASMSQNLQEFVRLRGLTETMVDLLAAPKLREQSNGSFQKLRFTSDELSNLVKNLGRSLNGSVEQVDRELRQVRETAERLRLVPISQIFGVLQRTARDVADTRGLRVELVATSGGDVRLEAQVVGLVQNALVQVVRNAVAHGIESPDERTRAGKTAEGRVTLRIDRHGSRVIFRCSDDGRGLDLEFVRRARATELGADKAGALEPSELVASLLKGGLSTATEVSSASGRGIGLDVVRQVMEELGGEPSITTDAGKGTTVTLSVPASLSSLDVLLLEASGQTVAIPVSAVRRSLRIPKSDLAKRADSTGVVFDGALIPFLELSTALDPESRQKRSDSAISAVVLEANGELLALGVDRLLGAENVVLRRLPASTPALPIVAGASLDTEGNPRLVLDAERVVALAREQPLLGVDEEVPAIPILVIDDSLTTRMLEQSILESAGYEVALAASAEEGLEKARARRFALMLVDVEMPGMDGFTFVETTQADPALRSVPAILVTSRDAPEDRQRGRDVGASDYIVKSEFDQRQLLDRIRGLVGKT